MDEGRGNFEKEVVVLDSKRKRIEIVENQEKIKETEMGLDNQMATGPKNGLEAGLGH